MDHRKDGGANRSDDEVTRSKHQDDDEKKSSARRTSRSRSRSPHRRQNDHNSRYDKSRRRHDKGGASAHSSRRHSPDTKDHGDRRYRHERRRSRSPHRHNRHEDRGEQNRGRIELRQQMARNYEEQLEKMRTNNQFAPPNQIAGKTGSMEPSKLVEQIERRKALFKKDKPVESATTSTTKLWQSAAFNDDSDGKVSAKFQRLMGIKTNEAAAPSTSSETETQKPQSGYLADLEKQYEVARTITHTQRGLGLGFGSRSAFLGNPNQKL